jgi:hypothetical protein
MFRDEPMYRVEEVARILDCDSGHIYDLIKLEKRQPGSGLVAVNIGASSKPTYRIRDSALARFFEQRATQIARESVTESSPHARLTSKSANALGGATNTLSESFAEQYVARQAMQGKGA